MKLIVGLGNPGSKYSLTRHNIGFIIADLFAERHNLNFSAGKGDFYFCRSENFVLLKPTTYMNRSGSAVAEFLESNLLELSHILIIYDDFQIPLGSIRIRPSGTDGGHNGIADIIYRLESLDIPRMRIGIGKISESDDSAAQIIKKDEYVDFVLSNFSQDEIEILKKMMPHYLDAIDDFIISDDIKKVMNKFNKNFII
ncbi:MAG: aminoacyl-tRNA hydrolase [Ignavibacteria bacterium]|nr:aminoacyl-tRNA hydrolase [Ignavibacteria bacterium]